MNWWLNKRSNSTSIGLVHIDSDTCIYVHILKKPTEVGDKFRKKLAEGNHKEESKTQDTAEDGLLLTKHKHNYKDYLDEISFRFKLD